MLPRPALKEALQAALARAPVVALPGPRQCGKTTLACQLVLVASGNAVAVASAWRQAGAFTTPERLNAAGAARHGAR
jgi:hypothetical protein